MELIFIEELEDGSALCSLKASKEEKEFLIQTGLITLIKDFAEQEERMKKIPVLERSVKHLSNEDMRYGDE